MTSVSVEPIAGYARYGWSIPVAIFKAKAFATSIHYAGTTWSLAFMAAKHEDIARIVAQMRFNLS